MTEMTFREDLDSERIVIRKILNRKRAAVLTGCSVNTAALLLSLYCFRKLSFRRSGLMLLVSQYLADGVVDDQGRPVVVAGLGFVDENEIVPVEIIYQACSRISVSYTHLTLPTIA